MSFTLILAQFLKSLVFGSNWSYFGSQEVSWVFKKSLPPSQHPLPFATVVLIMKEENGQLLFGKNTTLMMISVVVLEITWIGVNHITNGFVCESVCVLFTGECYNDHMLWLRPGACGQRQLHAAQSCASPWPGGAGGVGRPGLDASDAWA